LKICAARSPLPLRAPNSLGCSNQDHKKKHHAQEHKKYPGKPFSTREENPAKSFAIFFKRKTFTTKKDLAHKTVLKP
jgi:hypothetical protein